MSKLYKKSLFIFRRDIRLADNTALYEAINKSQVVIPSFIFDPRQYKNNLYFSNYSFSFLLDSLNELNRELLIQKSSLYIFNGLPDEIISKLILKEKIEAVFFNRDYTPFAKSRDNAVYEVCMKHGVRVHRHSDCLLNEPEDACKSDGSPYTIFTPFYKKNSKKVIKACTSINEFNFYKIKIASQDNKILDILSKKYKNTSVIKAGRKAALSILESTQAYLNYENERNFLVKNATTHLSAHNKYGTVSIREVYHALHNTLGPEHCILKQLYWRDFFTHIAFHFPHVFLGSFHKKYDQIEWENDKIKFKAWCNAETGFPIVDAAMRELNSSGYMHNRARMITASFLVKDLHIDWRWGEKYFANKLVDYDPAVNNGSWQWAASTGCDAQPYFRIFNPWLQQQKFDSECLYIKKWLPELKDTSPKVLHNLFKNQQKIRNYPMPIVNHAHASSYAKELFDL